MQIICKKKDGLSINRYILCKQKIFNLFLHPLLLRFFNKLATPWYSTILLIATIDMRICKRDGNNNWRKFCNNFISNFHLQSLGQTLNKEDDGHCIWRGVCYTDGAKKKNCAYNGTALPLDSTGVDALKQWCSHLLPNANNSDVLTCCDNEQVTFSCQLYFVTSIF